MKHTEMLLSEAIRLGAISCKWGRFDFCSEVTGERCAFGMAAYAVDISVEPNETETIDTVLLRFIVKWPYITRKLEHPSTRNQETLWSIVILLNDNKEMTPIQIADWVEEQERALGLWEGREQAAEETVAVEEKEAAGHAI